MLVTLQSHLGSKVKLRVTVILSLCSFQNKVFSVNTSFLNISAVHSVHSTVFSLAFTPSRFEAHGSSYLFKDYGPVNYKCQTPTLNVKSPAFSEFQTV